MTTPENPFVNAHIEIKLDELLAPETRTILEAGGSGVTISISQKTLRKMQTAAWDAGSATSLGGAERAVLAAVEYLGLTIREDAEPEEATDESQ
jgi:hypothetical protein